MRSINKFFEALSERLCVEKYLSDITYALLKADPNFKELFLEFCFEKKLEKINKIVREYSAKGSRVDFYFEDTQDKKEYILEVKIDDKNIHPEYKEKFKNMELAFIANYDAVGKPFYAEKTYKYVKTWSDFIKYLQENIKNIPNKDLIKGYILYVKKLINFLEAKSMNLSKTKSLIDFITVLEIIRKRVSKDLNVVLTPNNKKDSCGYDFCGQWLTLKKGRKEIDFWVGVYWDNPEWIPFVSIDCDKFKGPPKGNYYYTDDNRYILLNDELSERLNDDKEKIADQEEILFLFLKEFIDCFKEKT